MNYPLSYKRITSAPYTEKTFQIRDLFETPNYAVDLLVPFIPKHVNLIWEPAAGDGKIARRLNFHSYEVKRTDIRQSFDNQNEMFNYATDLISKQEYDKIDAVITNPPYSIKTMFIDRAIEYQIPFAFLIGGEYSGRMIRWLQAGCEKIIPTRRINYITPSGKQGKNSSSQFHTMWLTFGFNIGKTETFVELSLKEIKENI